MSIAPFVDSPPTTLHGIQDDLYAIDGAKQVDRASENPMTLEQEAINPLPRLAQP